MIKNYFCFASIFTWLGTAGFAFAVGENEASPITYDDVPPEVQVMVLPYLARDDIVKYNAVCQGWHALSKGHLDIEKVKKLFDHAMEEIQKLTEDLRDCSSCTDLKFGNRGRVFKIQAEFVKLLRALSGAVSAKETRFSAPEKELLWSKLRASQIIEGYYKEFYEAAGDADPCIALSLKEVMQVTQLEDPVERAVIILMHLRTPSPVANGIGAQIRDIGVPATEVIEAGRKALEEKYGLDSEVASTLLFEYVFSLDFLVSGAVVRDLFDELLKAPSLDLEKCILYSIINIRTLCKAKFVLALGAYGYEKSLDKIALIEDGYVQRDLYGAMLNASDFPTELTDRVVEKIKQLGSQSRAQQAGRARSLEALTR